MSEIGEIINGYKQLIKLLDEEYESSALCFGGELLIAYRELLLRQRETIVRILCSIYNNI